MNDMSISDMTIYTNNDVVADFLEKSRLHVKLNHLAQPALDVLEAVRGAIYDGAVLLSDPFVGVRLSKSTARRADAQGDTQPKISSINPYLSLLLSPRDDTININSASGIENAIVLFKRNSHLRFVAFTDEIIAAYKTVDCQALREVLFRVLEAMRK